MIESYPNDEYENFVNALLEVAAECIPNKQRNKPKVPWEKKHEDVKTASKYNRRNLTNINHIYQPLCSGRIWHKVNF